MKPRIPTGTRDFSPIQVAKRNYIFDTIKKTFEVFGFAPIETPTMELLSTLTGKYGDEGDKLLFKILNSGDFLKKAKDDDLASKNLKNILPVIAKRGLRYDLTVPFARYVVMHQNDLSFPFKRYQIQPVWRADRPQKGRYREFYQCDVDVVGSASLIYEAELIQIYDKVFHDLNIDCTIRINNRKILEGFAEVSGVKDQFIDMTVAIDKLDKIGFDGVERELQKMNFSESAIHSIMNLLKIKDLSLLKGTLGKSVTGIEGVQELEVVFSFLDLKNLKNKLELDFTLARGLNYYTGCIFEVVANKTKIGSIGGGGRYANLTETFGMKNMPGVGVSFGAERIFDVMEEEKLFPEALEKGIQILMITFNKENHHFAFKLVGQLRANGIPSDLYPDFGKFKKQMKYANAIKVPYIGIIGDDEMNAGKITLKNMNSGDQKAVDLNQLLEQFANI